MDIFARDNFAMYGCDINAFVEDVKKSCAYEISGAAMVIAGLMSDAQEQMEHQDTEGARQTLNRAKHLLFLTVANKLVFNSINVCKEV
jgi:hypothetical protein